MGLNFTSDTTWGRLILLSLSKKRPKKADPSGANHWLLSLRTLAPAASDYYIILGHPVDR